MSSSNAELLTSMSLVEFQRCSSVDLRRAGVVSSLRAKALMTTSYLAALAPWDMNGLKVTLGIGEPLVDKMSRISSADSSIAIDVSTPVYFNGVSHTSFAAL